MRVLAMVLYTGLLSLTDIQMNCAAAESPASPASNQSHSQNSQTQQAAEETNNETIEKLDSLLRGELSAIETYRQALSNLGNDKGAQELRQYERDHQEAAEKLRMEVTNRGGTPSQDSGVWGSWAKTVQGTARALGDTTALKALREGEEHGLDEYQEALDDEEIASEIKTLIREDFIKKQQEHIAGLNRFIAEKK